MPDRKLNKFRTKGVTVTNLSISCDRRYFFFISKCTENANHSKSVRGKAPVIPGG